MFTSQPPPTYQVQPGDTLSGIGERFGIPWPDLAQVNHVPNPDLIFPGQVFTMRRGDGEATVKMEVTSTSGRRAPRIQPAPTAWSGGYPGGSFGQCVVARESGGNSQVMNSSGHYGLYQFSESTWVAYGGNPASFGHASVAEQETVFSNALARGGQSNWAPYDGC